MELYKNMLINVGIVIEIHYYHTKKNGIPYHVVTT